MRRTTAALAAAAAVTVSWAGTGLAVADDVSMTNDPAKQIQVLDGGTGTFTVRLLADSPGAGGDPVEGCNATAQDPVTISFAAEDSWASTSVQSVQLTDCTTPHDVTVSVAKGTATTTAGAHTKIFGTATGGRSATVVTVHHGKGGEYTTTETVAPEYRTDFINVNVPALTPVSGNAAPVVSAAASDASGLEGDTLTSAGAFSDDGGADHLTITWTGAGSVVAKPDGTWGWSYPTDDNGSGTVVVRATDGAGLWVEDQFDWSAANVAPNLGAFALTRTGACSVDLTVSFTDPGTADTHVAGILWGDEAAGTEPTLTATTSPVTGSHTYPAAGSYTATVTVRDDDGGTGSNTGAFTAFNTPSNILAPINTNGSRSSFKIGSTIPVKITVTGCDGAAVSSLTPQVNLIQGDTSPDFPVNEVIYTESATNGKLMRWDATGQQYIYNLSTKLSQFTGGALITGTYTVAVYDPTFEKPVKATFDLRK